MRKYINIFLGLFLLSPIIYLFGLPLYQSLISVKSDVVKHLETRLPTEIVVDNKDEVFFKVDEFITIRHKVLNKSLDKFEEFCELLDKDGKVLDGSYYEYANSLNIESNRETSTYTILRKFIEDNPYGVYLKDIDDEFLEKKIDNFEESTKTRLEFLKRKYKNKFLIAETEYSFKNILDTFLYTYAAKQFLENDLMQVDIDEGIYKFRELTLNKTHSKYDLDFDAKPNLWKSVVNKVFYNKPLQDYYIDVFDLKNNNKFKSLHYKSKLIIVHILVQALTAHRVGKIYTNLEYLAINQYIGNSTLKNIDSMITTGIDKLEILEDKQSILNPAIETLIIKNEIKIILNHKKDWNELTIETKDNKIILNDNLMLTYLFIVNSADFELVCWDGIPKSSNNFIRVDKMTNLKDTMKTFSYYDKSSVIGVYAGGAGYSGGSAGTLYILNTLNSEIEEIKITDCQYNKKQIVN